MTEGTQFNTDSSAMTVVASRSAPPPTTVDLYEMSRMSNDGKAGGEIGEVSVCTF